ncbi:hypothetical protein ACYZX9_07095 [Sphingomonas citri]|jgi:hypothetical protein|uniref:Uncharacterized protein n=1 Tax=Sphingomonas citri TaxID=2862499 RepID=A0ABS7BNG5_9SPHN|nr:hypothetical protein [Sphingomonas citri]MBW6530997.1 hypothetical protein [Sphingomonas citri]
MDTNKHGFSYRSFAGWPALLAIALLIATVLYLNYGRDASATRLKPATGTARAMALAAQGGEKVPERP